MTVYVKLDDKELVKLAKGGDDLAFEQLVKNHQQTVATIAINMLKDYNDAEDIGQQVFIKLHKKLSSFRGDATLKTYISRMTMNYCLNELKRRRRFWERNKPIDEALSVQQRMHDSDTKSLVKKVLTYVDPKFRAVLVLRNIEGYSSKETAEILKIPLGTVLSRQKRGMEKMKEVLLHKFKYTYE